MLREMSTRYGRTPGGYVWAVVEPVGALIVMSIMFSILLRSPSLGNSFILFYASGYLPYTIYANIAGQVQSSIQFSKPLLQYPAVSWIDAILARFTLNLLTSITVFCIVFFGILQFTSATATLSLGPIVAAVALASPAWSRASATAQLPCWRACSPAVVEYLGDHDPPPVS